MARKFLNTIRSEVQTLLADNTTGNISAAEMRQVIVDTLDSTYESSAYVVSNAASPGTVVTATPAIIPMASPVSSSAEPTWLLANAINRQVSVLAPAVGFAVSAIVEATIEAANNDVIEFAIFQNGVATRWTAEATGRGAGRPASISLGGILIGSVGTIDLRVSSPAGSTVNFLTSSMIVSVRPTNAALP